MPPGFCADAACGPATAVKSNAAAAKLRPGVDVGPLATDAQHATVARHVEDAKAKGAKVIAGGEDGAGRAYLPTVVRVDDGK